MDSRRRVQALLRRAHLYAGLVMAPWLLFFGISGILFNHPNVGERVEGRRLPPEALERIGITGWNADEVAAHVVAELNALGGPRYVIDPAVSPELQGIAGYAAPSPTGRYTALVSPDRGLGLVISRHARPSIDAPPFSGRELPPGRFSLRAAEGPLHDLVADQGLPPPSRPLRLLPDLAPRARLGVVDDLGVAWNVDWDLGSSQVAGRRRDQWPAIGPTQLLGMLHTTHHFPLGLSGRWFWALFEDLLGLTMVFWAVSGLHMWWQVRARRRIGAACIVLSLGVAALVMSSTADDLTFSNVTPVLGPGTALPTESAP